MGAEAKGEAWSREKTYEVRCRATFSGCFATVSARDYEEAFKKANAGDFQDGIDINGAELVDFEIREVKR
jgi:hypothetical protein